MTIITKNEKFFKFTPQHLDVAKDLKVNELKLWLYLSLLDPFGDRRKLSKLERHRIVLLKFWHIGNR